MNRFDDFLSYLRKSVPTKRRTVVRCCEMKHNDGNTSLSGNNVITITIAKDLAIQDKIEVLIHEWGHALDLDDWEPHGKIWGEGMAQAYQAWEDFAFKKKEKPWTK